MALTATGVFQVDNGASGSDTLNAGYFNPAGAGAGTDYSITDPLACTDLAINAGNNTQVSSASIGFTAAHQRNGLRITAGTNFTVGLYEIISVSAGTATLDRAAGTAGATGGTARVGGALASPGQCGGMIVAGNAVFLKNTGTPYTMTASNNVAGGRFGPALAYYFAGYTSNRTLYNTDARPVVRPAAVNVQPMFYTGAGAIVRNISVTNPSAFTGVEGIRLDNGGGNCGLDCDFDGLANPFNMTFQSGTFQNCVASGFTGAVGFTCQNAGKLIACIARDWTSTATDGFALTSACHAIWCAAVNGKSRGFLLSDNQTLAHCIAYNIATGTGGGMGFDFAGANSNTVALNCISYGNAAYGYRSSVNPCPVNTRLYNCAGGNNPTADFDARIADAVNRSGSVTLTGNPFTNPAGRDYSLNNTLGAGAACRAAGWPGTFPGLATATYPDLGIVQGQAGGGTPVVWG